jgi:Xaa-Pro aminopeptidase
MEDVLIYGDTVRSAEMRHELPLLVPDPFLYLEKNGERHVLVSPLERPRIAALDSRLEVHTGEEFGFDELIAGGTDFTEALLEVAVRACQALNLQECAVPGEFPLELADRLRAAGVSVVADRERFAARRRVKSEAELAGIRRAQVAAQAGMTTAAQLLRSAEVAEDGLLTGGEPLTCELIKDAVREAVGRAGGSMTEDLIVSHGPQSAIGHDLGSGRIQPNEPVVIDLWPRDLETGCHADMTRTFVVGEAPEELRRYHTLTLEALERSRAAVKAGVPGQELHRLSCEPYHGADLPTLLSKRTGEVLVEGFYHLLGHGVGLEVHEAPLLGLSSDVLAAGDVITLEPGAYRPGFGGCRLEDLLYVTEDGSELLTDFPYELEP